jgi:hypothetical protein
MRLSSFAVLSATLVALVRLRRSPEIETKRASRCGPRVYRVRHRRGDIRDRKQSGLTRFSRWQPVTFEVDNFESAVRHLRDHHVAFFLSPSETKVCHWAAFRDLDGNHLVIHKRKRIALLPWLSCSPHFGIDPTKPQPHKCSHEKDTTCVLLRRSQLAWRKSICTSS